MGTYIEFCQRAGEVYGYLATKVGTGDLYMTMNNDHGADQFEYRWYVVIKGSPFTATHLMGEKELTLIPDLEYLCERIVDRWRKELEVLRDD